MTEISGCREPRLRIHCVTDLATGHRPRCLGICWWIQVSQGHLLYVAMFNPERSVPQVSKVVEMLFCCLIALKRAFPGPVRVMHGLGNVLAHQGIRFSCLTGRKLRKLSDRSTNWTSLSTTVGKGNDQDHTPMSTWYQGDSGGRDGVKSSTVPPWWKQNVRSAQKPCESCLWHPSLDGFECWTPAWCSLFQGRRRCVNPTQYAGMRRHFCLFVWLLLLVLLC